MDRALNPELIRQALGTSPPQTLPTVEELRQLLARAELSLLVRRYEETNTLLGIGWYLHGIGSSKHAMRAYGISRIRAAFQVSGHIFDLMSKFPEVSPFDRLTFVFASQIAYLRSQLSPNAIAMYNRDIGTELVGSDFLDSFQPLALTVAIAFLGFDTRFVFETARSIRNEVTQLTREWGIDSIFNTPFGAAYGVIRGTNLLAAYLVHNNENALEQSRDILRQAVNADASLEDHSSRWVAAHLLNLADDLQATSLWTVLPPEVPSHIRKGFAQGSPPVLTLWPPQLDLFHTGINPLSGESKRLFLSTPTSGGKTLLAQLLIVSHLEIQKTSVCYVAPTRSLCREVRRTLAKRLSFIEAEVSDSSSEWDSFDEDKDPPEVEVMTPERLSYLLRTNSEETLHRFGFFVFDEVHLVGEAGRGWTLEESLTYINAMTQETNHRIAMISAVVGNRHHFIQWLRARDVDPIHTESDWRGPRRIHAIYSTMIDWSNYSRETTQSPNYSHRGVYPQYGKLDVRISHTGDTHSLQLTEPVGKLVLKCPTPSDSSGPRDTVNTTSFYKMLVPLIDYLAEMGSVLVVESTRIQSVRTAKAIAEEQEIIDVTDIQYVLDLVEARLTEFHPLHRLLQKGVAYHHGSLPDEIRVAIEELVSDGYINVLVATTTMTEGVNMPVRSVVIASQGSHDVEGYKEYITGSKLINAIGRAGRATKETEGIVVLAWNQSLTDDVIERLSPDDTEMQVISTLHREEALAELAEFEQMQREAEDAIFEIHPGYVSDFLKFTWFIAARLEELSQPFSLENIQEVLEHSLGWLQLNQENRQRWINVAEQTVVRYRRANPSARKRWARSSTSLNSARRLDEIAQQIAAEVVAHTAPHDAENAIDFILANGRLHQIQQLPEFGERAVYNQRTGRNRQRLDIPLDAILKDWVRGESLITLADRYLEEVDDIEFKYEQLGDFINHYFEVHLPWIFSTLIGWINEFLAESEDAGTFNTDLPSYIRWGVNSSIAVDLLNRGILSRRLAMRIAEQWQPVVAIADVYHWIRGMELTKWQQLFEPSTAELRSLLDYSRQRRGGIASELIRKEVAKVEVNTLFESYPETAVLIGPIERTPVSPVGIFHGRDQVGEIRSRDQRDIQDILSLGLALSIHFHAEDNVGEVVIRVTSVEDA